MIRALIAVRLSGRSAHDEGGDVSESFVSSNKGGEERGVKSKHSDCSTATHDYANCDEEARGRIRVSVRGARACLFLRKDT